MSSSLPIGRVGKRLAMVAGIAALLGMIALAVTMSQRGDAAYPGLNSRIAYSAGVAYTTSIWSANSDGTAPAQLTTGTSDYNPVYSADGTKIAFNRENGVYVMSSTGGSLTQLAPGLSSNSSSTEWQENYDDPNSTKTIPFVKVTSYSETWQRLGNPSFSPDGSQLAVSESKGAYKGKSICAVEALHDQTCNSGYGGGGSLEPNEEPYFNYEEECNGCISHIITISSTTGAQVSEVTPPSTTTEDFDPTYAPNGALAFARWENGNGKIYVVGSPGAAPVAVTSGPYDVRPNFSPDSSRIVFVHGGRELGVVGVGGGPVSILPNPLPAGATTSFVESPAFSPDGTKITFERSVYGKSGRIESGIFTMGSDGSALTKIVNEGHGPNWEPIPFVKPVAIPPKKGKSPKLNKKHQVTIGTITCGNTPCTLQLLSAKLKVGKKQCAVKVKLPAALAPGGSVKVTPTIKGKCLSRLEEAGKGTLTVKVSVTSATGTETLTFKSTVKPGHKGKGGSGKKGKGHKGKGGKGKGGKGGK
jgi:Tol biopolymer transport system component